MKVMVPLIGSLLAMNTSAQAHDAYHDWKTPNGISCCNKEDCHPTTAYLHDDGQWRAQHKGREIIVPDHAWQRGKRLPDGRTHICVPPSGIPICFSPGEIRS